MSRFWCEYAWLGGEEVTPGVLIEVDDGRIISVTTEVERPFGDVTMLPGYTLPGLANAHSHAFQRAFRGKTEVGRGTFWTWRERMYEAAARLDPDSYRELARATFAEMALAGVTAVGEFHYIHHEVDGTPYADPNAMGEAVIAGAREAGIRITLIDACYLHGGIGVELNETQRRFSDGTVARWIERVEALRTRPDVRIGAAIHSVRAAGPDEIPLVAGWASARDVPLHAHVSEQPAEDAACRDAYGKTPTEVFEAAGALSPRFTAIHVTHPTDRDRQLLGGAGATCCFCPTTERNLADGIGPASRLRQAGCGLAVGSDSQAAIDIFEECRAIELDERLATLERGNQDAVSLLRTGTVEGHRAIGWPDAGVIAPGMLADLLNLDGRSVRLAGITPASALSSIVFAASAGDVTNLLVGGKFVVRNGCHRMVSTAAELRRSIAKLDGVR